MWQKQTSKTTLLWYDYETWGAEPQRDGIAQFAAIRTDLDLNPIGEPIDIICKPMIDMVVDADAVMITGISPIQLREHGMTEWDFATQIHSEMAVPGTCTVGYNTIRFDDECTRYLFYRNLHDPYAREWKNGNSRWDILDVVRMTAALRPEGITWPTHYDGSPSFKLEHLTAANGLSHEKAHDAVSDVLATIAMAKLIKDRQPKLFSYAFQLRSKHEVRKHLDLNQRTPHLHFSGKIPALEHCLGVEMPIMVHPERSNEVVVLDLRQDPSWIINHSAEQLKNWLYSKKEDLPEGQNRPPLRTIHLNKSPMIAPMSLMDPDTAVRLGIDIEQISAHREIVESNPSFIQLIRELYCIPNDLTFEHKDPQHALYNGFIDDHDRNVLNRMVHNHLPKEQWLAEAHILHDDRLEPLIENILARHFPEYLDEKTLFDWKKEKAKQIVSEEYGQRLTLDDALLKIQALLAENPDHESLKDTLTYLVELKNQWTVEQTNESSQGDGNQSQNNQSNANEHVDAKTTPSNIDDQLDLF